MRNVFYILILITIMSACKSNSQPKVQDTVSALSTTDQTPSLIQKFKPLLQGAWVKNDYILALAKSKSPINSSPDGIVDMYFDTDSISDDSLLVPVGWVNHEGGQFTLKFQNGISKNSLRANLRTDTSGGFHELEILVLNNDTSLMLCHFNKYKKLLEKIKYKKIFSKVGTGDATHYIVNKLVITGKYAVNDTLGNSSNVKFTNEGDMSGLKGFKTYSLAIDFNGPESNLDEIIFDGDQYSNKAIRYSFKFNKDTLSLFDITENTDSTELILGKRIYKLVKQK